MKKFIIILVIATLNFKLSTLNCLSQPNPGFEKWSTVFGIQEPDDWQTWNFTSLGTPPNQLSVFKASGVDKHSGNYAMKIKTIYLNYNPNPQFFPDSTGFAFTGKINLNPITVKYGYPYSGRPEKLEFWAKYYPVGNDTAAAIVALLKWNGTSSDTIALGVLTFGATAQYSLFQLTLHYFLPDIPDTASIGFASTIGSSGRIGSTLYVDDLSFTGWVGIDEPSTYPDNKVKLFPNPVTDNLTLSTDIAEANEALVTDISGKTIGVYKIVDHRVNISTAEFEAGTYFCELRDKKNKILTKSKFTVVK